GALPKGDARRLGGSPPALRPSGRSPHRVLGRVGARRTVRSLVSAADATVCACSRPTGASGTPPVRSVAAPCARPGGGSPHGALGRVGGRCDGVRMQETDGVLRLSATDLTTHLACAHATTLDLEAA